MKKFTTLAMAIALVAGLNACAKTPNKAKPAPAKQVESTKSDQVSQDEKIEDHDLDQARSDSNDTFVPDEAPKKPIIDSSSTIALAAAEFLKRPDQEVPTVEVEHILIAFRGSMRSTATRTQAEAKELAWKLIMQITDEASFDAIKIKYTDDGGQKDADGTYRMYDKSKGGVFAAGMMGRENMAKAFADVSWKLKVGEIGITNYNDDSPFGYHIIRRVK